MIKSMTGFGRGKLEVDGREYILEIKSVNHKYSDISIKMPKNFSFVEDEIRKEINKNISRGKIDVNILYLNNGNKQEKVIINKALAKNYINEIRQLINEADVNSSINIMEIIKLPDVLNIQSEEPEEQIAKEIKQVLNIAIEEFLKMREKEGETIYQDLVNRIDDVNINVEQILRLSTGLIEEYIVKLKKRIEEILKNEIIDENRLAQEVVIYADKSSIEEEITRLKSHIQQFKELLDIKEPVGKRLDFLIQEMNREANTIASKSTSIDITNIVVELKTQIENIREQIQNIE